MGLVFEDPLHDEFASWALGFAPYGGADVGEVLAIAAAVGQGADEDAFFEAWTAMADRLAAEGADALARGRWTSARECLLHAASYNAVAYHPLYGEPVDHRPRAAFGKQMRAFGRATELSDPPAEPVPIPFEGCTLPGWLIRAMAPAPARPGPC